MIIAKRLPYLPIQVLLLFLVACGQATPDQLLSDAKAAMAAGEIRTAEIHLKNLLQQQPDNADARLMLGQVSLEQGDFPTAEQTLKRALESGADPAAVQLPLLRSLAGQRKFDELLAQIESGPAASGEDRVPVLELQGTAHVGKNDLAAAEADYRAALAIDPKSTSVRTALAAVLLQTGKTDEANNLVADLLTEQPDYVPALRLRGSMELLARRYGAAEGTFDSIARLLADTPEAGDYSNALARLVEAELAQEKNDDAAKNADKLLSMNPRSPLARYLKAKVEMAQGDLDGAEHRLEEVIANVPQYWPAYTVLGAINTKQGQLGQAQQYLRQAVANNPSDRAARLQLAELYIRQGDLDSAKELLVRQGGPALTDAQLLAFAGNVSQQLGDKDLASQYFERSGEQKPQNLQELVGLSGAYLASGEFERAVKLLESSPSLDSGEHKGVEDYLLVLAQLSDGDLKAAQESAKRLAAKIPEASWLLNLQAVIDLRLGEVPAARELLTRAVKLDPKNAPVLLNSARAALAAGDKAAAEEQFRRVNELDPKQTTALLGLTQLAADRKDYAAARSWAAKMPVSPGRFMLEGEIGLREGQYDAAATAFSRSYALLPSANVALRAYAAAERAGRENPDAELLAWSADHPADERVNFALGSVALGKQDFDGAIKRFEAVLDADPKQAETLNNLAWLYDQRNDERALDLAKRAYEAQPDNPAIADTLGWIQVRRGDAAAGLQVLTDAAAKAADQPEIRYHWAAALAKTGDKAKAQEVLQALLASDTPFPSRRDAEQLAAETR